MTIVRPFRPYPFKLTLSPALVVAHDYHSNAQTLYEAHLKPKVPTFHNGRVQTQSTAIPERTMWTYVVQIASAIKVVHDAGLAVRMIEATKVLLTGKNRCSHNSTLMRQKHDRSFYTSYRIRISSCGIVDVLMYDSRQDIAVLQQEDLAMFGRLIFQLCCNNLAVMNSETLGRQYSGDMKNVVLFLISKPGPHKVRQSRRYFGWTQTSCILFAHT
jgi:PAB-dependent poly(A)-specific ribonuclease subunit 3